MSKWTWTAEEWKQYHKDVRKIAAKHMWNVSEPLLALIKKAEENSREASTIAAHSIDDAPTENH